MSLSDPDYALVERIADALESLAGSASILVRHGSNLVNLVEEMVARQRAEAEAHQALAEAARPPKVSRASRGGAP